VPVVQPLVSKDGILTAYPPTNRLVVVDSSPNVERLAGLLRDLDVPHSERATDTVALRYAPADELAARLRQTLAGDTPGGPGRRARPEARPSRLLRSGSLGAVARARALVGRLDVAMPGASQLHVSRLHYAHAEGLVRVLSQLLGLPPPPP